ncbi:MAG: diguanylate cyclase [Nitrospirota bacterium]
MPDPFVILRSDGIIYDINSNCSNLIGLKKKDIIGKDFRNFNLFDKLGETVMKSLSNKKEDFARIVYKDKHFDIFILPFKEDGKLKLIRIFFRDITNFVHLEKELLKRNKELIIISTLSNTFISSENMDIIVEDLLEKVLLITDFSIGWLLLEENHSFKMKTSRGISSELQRHIEEGVLEPLCKEAIRLREPLYIVESYDISRINPLVKEGIVFLTAIPLLSNKNPIGLLFLASRDIKGKFFDFDIATLLSLIGNNFSLILEKIKLFQETKRLSITDGLTGLYNRRYFNKYLDIEIARAKRYNNFFSVMLFDIDNFKKINDTHGHQAGDEVLQELANIFKSVSRETDTIVRYGGEEFIIILPNTSEEETLAFANRIKIAVENNIFVLNNSKTVNITLSGGIASYPQNAGDAKSLLSAADAALYAAKASGRNKILCFKENMHEKNIQKTSKS